MKRELIALTLGLLAGTALSPVDAQEITGVPGSPDATTTIDGKQLPPPDPKFGGVIEEKASEFHAVVAAARRAAEGCTQRAAHHDGRPGFRGTEHLRRGHSHACHGSHREQWAALH